LLRGDSRFDKAVFGGQRDALSEQEWRGYQIFSSKGGCSACHSIGEEIANFSDQAWHNTGVAFRSRNESQNVTVEIARGVVKSVDVTALGLAPLPLRDVGRFEITNNPVDRWAYTTPFLRGVKETAPYMHDGSLSTLEEVIDFYDHGGGPNPALDKKIRPLGLTHEEKAELVAFLKVL
jgi:cytochrome c peroxidase